MLDRAVPTRPPGAVLPAPGREAADHALLTGPDAHDLLTAVLDAEGLDLVASAVHQVHHRPGVGVTVGYTVGWRARTGSATGEEYLLVTTSPLPATRPAGGVAAVQVDGRTLHVWRHPADPALPALPRASDAEAVARVLGAHRVELDLVTYRPLRRAVLRAQATTAGAARATTSYLKVVRPHTAADLHRRHELLREVGVPAARTRLFPDGLVVLDELPGAPLTEALAADGAARLSPATVVDLLDRLPSSTLDLPRRAAWAEHVDRYVAAAVTALPAQAERLISLGTEVADLVAASDPGPLVPTHGDLHDANLLLDRSGDVVGLLDVDTVGPGHRVDDLACLLGHLSVLPVLAPDVHRRVPATLTRWTAALEARVDPVALHARTAAVVLSLVSGSRQQFPSSDAESWVDVVDRWVVGARAPGPGL